MHSLVEKFQEYSTWRFELTRAIEGYRGWARTSGLLDREVDARVTRLLAQLAQDRLTIAFIAEFSRGKSELINAIFFADYGKRILPSSAGRTTMCPTELMYDDTLPPSIRLLPIETRARHATTADYRSMPDEWQVHPLDTGSGDGMLDAFRQVSLTKRVPVAEAQTYGLYDAEDPDHQMLTDHDGLVEISMWRHAIVNFPHPLLAQGLVILDTPGLNAIGTEPELTLNLIPNAHAVLFILAADTGVTKTDIEVWRQHIAKASGRGRIVVLNKIDSLWDDLTPRQEVDAMIERQVESCAKTLGISQMQVFPVSAQKGLSAKVHNDEALLAKSRLPALERALSIELIPRKQEIFRDIVKREMGELVANTHSVLQVRAAGFARQAADLRALRGRNTSVVTHMVTRVRAEKSAFDRSLIAFQALRSVFTKVSGELFVELGVTPVREEIRATRERMVRSWFSTGLRGVMENFFITARDRLVRSQAKTDEISGMVAGMYKKFASDHGMMLSTPMKFSLARYQNEVIRVEDIYHDRFGLIAIFSNDQLVLTQKFFESIASRIRETFEAANRDVEAWLKAVMAPLEGQIREHQGQLRRRLESIKQIQDTSVTLEDRLEDATAQETGVNELLTALADVDDTLQTIIDAEIDAEQGALIFLNDEGPDVATFATTLIDWQRAHGRHALPWQQLDASFDRRRDAYRVWLAEIMLQQTQVAAVVPFYRRFVERFPDVRVLADASHDDVMQHWSGLGYYSRARNLHATARRVVDDFGGRFPDDVAALERLPGIGRSTAAAIAAFAFGRRAAILDGNVKRVLARLFGIEGPLASSGFTRRAWALAEALLPAPGSERGIEHDITHYTQGLMDLGATLCTPRKPSCLICPFRSGCVAHREGREESLPERTTKKPLPRRRTTVVVVARGGRVLLERRPPVGIWGGLWSLPEIEADAEDAAIEIVARRLGGTDVSAEAAIGAIERRPGFVHGFTHFVLEAEVVRVELVGDAGGRVDSPPEATRWIALDELRDVGLPTPIRTLLSTMSA